MISLTVDPRTINAAEFPADGTPEEQWCFLLHYALLAPSEYNTQPWLFHIRGERMDLYADFARRLPVVDPEDRELLISCGATYLNLFLAARRFGLRVFLERFFEEMQEPAPLASLTLRGKLPPSAEEEQLFSAIPKRQTNRSLFSARALPQAVIDRMQSHAALEHTWMQIVQDEDTRATLVELIINGDHQQWKDRHFREELAEWLHPRDPGNVDGLPGSAQPRGSEQGLTNPLVVRTFDLSQTEGERQRVLAENAPTLVLVGTFADTPADWFAAGITLERILLEACASGLQTSFVNQPIEIPALRTQLCHTLGCDGFPQLILRIGYGQPVSFTPRRRVYDVLLAPLDEDSPAAGRKANRMGYCL